MSRDDREAGVASEVPSPRVTALARLRHDLRTPLNAIIGYSEMLLEDAAPGGRSAAISADLEKVRQGGLHLLALVNDLLKSPPDASADPDLEEVGRSIRAAVRPPLDQLIGLTNALLEKAETGGLTDPVPDIRRIRDAGLRMLSLVEADSLAAIARSAITDASSPAASAAAADEAVDSPPASGINTRSFSEIEAGRLLVIDDQETNRDILSRYLQRHGHQVTTASGGRQGLALLAREPFDLVLLDIVMPDMNGYQVLQQLKSDQMLSQIPVIFISALDDALGKVQAFKSGGVDYVTKPFQADEVNARVENQLKLSRLQKDLGRQNDELLRKNEELTQAQRRTDLVFSALAEALPGTILDAKYRLEERIGTGGFGAVFRGTHLGLNLPVAIKVFRPMSGNDTPDALERFRQEGVAASRIKHPNVVEIHDNGISSTGIAYLVMELLQGHTLAQELADKRRLTPERAAAILVPVCETLAEFHAAGIVHRDIKPENIYLHQARNEEVVKLLDFGLSKMWGPSGEQTQVTMTLGDAVIGTLAYMAPERLLNKAYDGRSDVYSLGVVMYRMLSGTSPFQADPSARYLVAMMQLTAEAPPLRSHVDGLPPELDELVARMLSKDPEGRPSARELPTLIRAIVSPVP